MASWLNKLKDDAIKALEEADRLAAERVKEDERQESRKKMRRAILAGDTEAANTAVDDDPSEVDTSPRALPLAVANADITARKTSPEPPSRPAVEATDLTCHNKDHQRLQHEIGALESELAAFSSRYRSCQEALNDSQHSLQKLQTQYQQLRIQSAQQRHEYEDRLAQEQLNQAQASNATVSDEQTAQQSQSDQLHTLEDSNRELQSRQRALADCNLC